MIFSLDCHYSQTRGRGYCLSQYHCSLNTSGVLFMKVKNVVADYQTLNAKIGALSALDQEMVHLHSEQVTYARSLQGNWTLLMMT